MKITPEQDLAARLHAHAEEVRQSKKWSAYVADDFDNAAKLLLKQAKRIKKLEREAHIVASMQRLAKK